MNKRIIKELNERIFDDIQVNIDPELPTINKPYTPKDQYILNYVHEEPKGVVHEDEGMSRLIGKLMR